jgi:hypothetical protein
LLISPLRSDSHAIALILLAWSIGGGCADPCAELEARVCERHEDTKRCDLMQDPERRRLLSNEACEGILQVVPKE